MRGVTDMLKGVAVLLAVAWGLATVWSSTSYAGEKGSLEGKRMLVFSKTKGWRHDSIPEGIVAMTKLGIKHGFDVVATEDTAEFTDETLKTFDVVMFLNTTGDVLERPQEEAMERYIQAGGGFVGVHSASNTEDTTDWVWYQKMVGGLFVSHPDQQDAKLNVVDGDHPSTKGMSESFERWDEWYNFRDLNPNCKHLVTIDETSYEGGTNGDPHPISWYHDYDGGRAFYTAMGHTKASYREPLFMKHVLGGIIYAAGHKH